MKIQISLSSAKFDSVKALIKAVPKYVINEAAQTALGIADHSIMEAGPFKDKGLSGFRIRIRSGSSLYIFETAKAKKLAEELKIKKAHFFVCYDNGLGSELLEKGSSDSFATCWKKLLKAAGIE